jgi:hypothetical protein
MAQAQKQEKPSGALQAFMLTTTYGVIAGTLTGIASLAFYESPGERTRNIALGASIGLYMGILLGAYVVYSPPPLSPQEKQRRQIEEEEAYDDDPIDLGVKARFHHQYAYMGLQPSWQPLLGVSEAGTHHFGVKFNF